MYKERRREIKKRRREGGRENRCSDLGRGLLAEEEEELK